MKPRYKTWDEAVMSVMGSHYPHEVDLETIYAEVGRHRELTDWDLQETEWGELRYENTVRKTLCDLVKKGMAERIRRGVYVLKDDEDEAEHGR